LTRAAITPWPELPEELSVLLDEIEGEAETGGRHPRPWDVAGLKPKLAEMVWSWLPDAVAWINDHHAWQPEVVIPPCWPQHPDLVLELAVLAFSREAAVRTTVPRELKVWHDDLREFQTHMRESAGEIPLRDCRRGEHVERPSDHELSSFRLHRHGARLPDRRRSEPSD
jgi:hypothetical protein